MRRPLASPTRRRHRREACALLAPKHAGRGGRGGDGAGAFGNHGRGHELTVPVESNDNRGTMVVARQCAAAALAIGMVLTARCCIHVRVDGEYRRAPLS